MGWFYFELYYGCIVYIYFTYIDLPKDALKGGTSVSKMGSNSFIKRC